jgi:hypothetical protein
VLWLWICKGEAVMCFAAISRDLPGRVSKKYESAHSGEFAMLPHTSVRTAADLVRSLYTGAPLKLEEWHFVIWVR